MTELKPCPFCGWDGTHIPVAFPKSIRHVIECVNHGCHIRTPAFATETEAIAAWNTRHQSAEAPASEWAMGVWNASQVAFKSTSIARSEEPAQAAARIIEQAFAEREAPVSEDAMEVARKAREANNSVPNPFPTAGQEAAARIIQQYGDQCEAAGYRRGVEEAANAAHDAICEYGLKGGRLSYGDVSAIGYKASLALIETQEKG